MCLCCDQSEQLVQHDTQEHVCLHRPELLRSASVCAAERQREQVHTCLQVSRRAHDVTSNTSSLPHSSAQLPPPLRGQWAELPPTVSAAQRLRPTGCDSLAGLRAAAPSTAVS